MESWGGPRRSNADRRTGDPAPVEQLPATPAARIGFADRVMVTASGARQPIVAILPLQLLAYEIARARGLNVDQPRNLAKTVTVE